MAEFSVNNSLSLFTTRERMGIDSVRNAFIEWLSLEDYESLNETAYLLQSPKNAKRLLHSINQLEKGKGKKQKLLT